MKSVERKLAVDSDDESPLSPPRKKPKDLSKIGNILHPTPMRRRLGI
jgi:hypothetical protein